MGRKSLMIAIFAIAMFIGIASFTVTGFKSLNEHQDLAVKSAQTDIWVMAQAALALERAMHSLHMYVEVHTMTPRAEAMAHYDALRAQLPAITQAPEAKQLRQFEDVYATVSALEAILARLDPQVKALQKEDHADYEVIHDQLQPFTTRLNELAAQVAANIDQIEHDHVIAVSERTSRLQWSVIAIIIGAVAMMILLLLETLQVRHTAQQARDAEQRAEEASKAKSAFLANMSHELRTPLTGIIGFSGMMEQETMGPLPPKYKEYAHDIEKSGKHLLDLINDILDLSKAEANKIELEADIHTVYEIAEHSERLVSGMLDRYRVDVIYDLPPSLPEVRVDRRRVVQCVVNLLSNAIKFSPNGAQVRLTAQSTPNNGLIISIHDQGEGMNEEDLANAMKPFGQVRHSHMVQHEPGTGLGLPLVKLMMELHDGDLAIETAPGQGTIAQLIFPAHRVVRRFHKDNDDDQSYMFTGAKNSSAS